MLDYLYMAGGGAFLMFLGFQWLKQKRMIENIPTSKIRSVAMGLVELKGKPVQQDQMFKAPFSREECVYYKYTIEEYRKQGKHSKWVTVDSGTKGNYFYLDDGTGSVLVDTDGAEISMTPSYQADSRMGRDPPKEVKSFLEQSPLHFEGFLGINKRMRYREYSIVPGQQIYVIGTARDNPFIEEASTELDVMIAKGKNESFFYITDKKEVDAARSLGWKAFGSIIGGGLLVLCGLILFIFELNLI